MSCRAIETHEISRSLAEKSIDATLPVILPMVVGAMTLSVPTALVLYVVVLYSVSGFQAARRRHRVDATPVAPAKEGERA